jgi:dTDP-glucose 4,6-dehydratase
MKILVTGGAGFIGSNFLYYLAESHSDWEVVCLDKLTYAGHYKTIEPLIRDGNISFIKGDIADRACVDGIISAGIEVVVNFAAESHVDRSILDASPFIRTNVLGTQTLLDSARANGVERFLQVSTDEVYGALGADGLFHETTPLAPNSPYSASKAGADLLVRAAFKTHGFPTLTTRCSNNYGPYQFPEKLIPLMINNALNNEPLPVYGDGMYIRDWLHVRDHCEAITTVLEHGKPGEVYNIGGDSEKENLWIIQTLLQLLDRPSELITHVKDRPGHDRRYAIDHSRITDELGWQPRIDLKQGLQSTVQWYLDNQPWWQEIKSGEYLKYYEKQYGDR